MEPSSEVQKAVLNNFRKPEFFLIMQWIDRYVVMIIAVRTLFSVINSLFKARLDLLQ